MNINNGTTNLIGLSAVTAKKHLKDKRTMRRVGSDKGDYWEIMLKHDEL